MRWRDALLDKAARRPASPRARYGGKRGIVTLRFRARNDFLGSIPGPPKVSGRFRESGGLRDLSLILPQTSKRDRESIFRRLKTFLRSASIHRWSDTHLSGTGMPENLIAPREVPVQNADPSASPQAARPQVVVIGGGFGGLEAVKNSRARRSMSRSSTAATTTCFSRCSTRWLPPVWGRPTSPVRCGRSSGTSKTWKCS